MEYFWSEIAFSVTSVTLLQHICHVTQHQHQWKDAVKQFEYIKGKTVTTKYHRCSHPWSSQCVTRYRYSPRVFCMRSMEGLRTSCTSVCLVQSHMVIPYNLMWICWNILCLYHLHFNIIIFVWLILNASPLQRMIGSGHCSRVWQRDTTQTLVSEWHQPAETELSGEPDRGGVTGSPERLRLVGGGV